MTTHESKTTVDHAIIRRWAEARGGKPATVHATGDGGGAGVLRIAFTDDEKLDPIDWDDFFDKFEAEDLAFLYQDQTADGKESRFFKLVGRRA